ncbi:MAG: CoA-binding protein [Candidatus Thorarchaeota archaeon]
MMSAPMKPTIKEMLDINSVAIVGVSAQMGYYWAHSMLQWEHDLNVWLVSRSGGEVLGHKVYENLKDVPEKIDYAIIAVPFKAVSQVLIEAVEKGAKGVTIFTSGFSELGSIEGEQREKELKDLLDSLPIRAFGPNCMGLMYPKIGFAFMPTVKRLSGNVGLLSQSGGVVITSYTAAVESGVGISKVFSFGNATDITPDELIEYFEHDTDTDAVGVYIEGTKDGESLLARLSSLAKTKPVVALKGGRSQAGTKAVSSHTGALAGNNEIWNAAFRQANAMQVDTLEELVATLSVFSKCPPPKSRKTAIIAISGGTSVVYTDFCVEAGLEIPPSSESTVKALRSVMRSVGNAVGNPIDLAADYYADQILSEVVRIVGEDPEFDSIIMQADVHNIHQVAVIMDAEEEVQYLWGVMAEAGRKVMEEHQKPVLVAIPDVAYPMARMKAWEKFVEQGLPVFRNIDEAVGSLVRVCEYYSTQQARKSETN